MIFAKKAGDSAIFYPPRKAPACRKKIFMEIAHVPLQRSCEFYPTMVMPL